MKTVKSRADQMVRLSKSSYQWIVENKMIFAGLSILFVLSVLSFASNLITQYNPNAQGDILLDRYLAPGWEHLFGTDKFGRDIFSRVLYGGRISLTIAILVVLIASTIGFLYGIISGYFGGWVDSVMMRILDFLLAFPIIFLLIMLIAIFEINHWYLIPVLGLTGWMETARLVRAEVLSIKERDFILAARGMGFSHFRILFNHIVPNCLTTLFVIAPLKVAEIVLLESALSFLGIGVQAPTPSWGALINDGRASLLNAWWISTFPGIFITATVMGFHFIGNGLKAAIDRQN